MEHWPSTAFDWINENREWLFSGAGIVIISAVWAVLRFIGGEGRQNPGATDRSEGNATSDNGTAAEESPADDGLKPLLVHTTDGYLAQVGVLLTWRIEDPILVITNLGKQDETEKKITDRVRYHLIEALETKALGEIREERALLSQQLLDSVQDEMRPLGVEFESIKIGRVTPVDRHA